MTKKLFFALLLSLALLSCTKEVLRVSGRRLAEVTVESDAGELPVLINAEGIWKARSLEDWISVDEAWHEGAYTVLLRYGSNRSVEGMHRTPRTGAVLILTADGAECDTLFVHQKGMGTL